MDSSHVFETSYEVCSKIQSFSLCSKIHNPCPCGLFHFGESMSHCSHEILSDRETVRNYSNIHVQF